MTESLKIATLASSIAAQSISVVDVRGTAVTLNIRDLDSMQDVINAADCPLLQPAPDPFVSALSIPRVSYGADVALKDALYTLNYVFYYAPVLQKVGSIFQHYGDCVDAVATIAMWFGNHTNLTGSQEFQIDNVPHVGRVTDAAGTQFLGCVLSFRVQQFTEA